MRRRELEIALREAGFSLFKEGSRHTIYAKGSVRIGLPRGRQIERRLAKLILVVIKRSNDGQDSGMARIHCEESIA